MNNSNEKHVVLVSGIIFAKSNNEEFVFEKDIRDAYGTVTVGRSLKLNEKNREVCLHNICFRLGKLLIT